MAALGLVAVACAGVPPTVPSVPPPPPTARPKVMIVSIDGMRADAAQTAAPNLVALSLRGAFSWRAQTVVPSITLSGHASMLSGDTPSVHGMTWAEWDPREATITVPTIFTMARSAGLDTAMVVGKPKLAHLNAPGSTDVFVVCGSDDDVAVRALAEINAERDLVFVHLPDTDLAGHRYGWMSAQYVAALSRADQALGRLITAAPPSTTFVVTADHGGHANDHHAGLAVDMTIPWVIAGPGVKTGLALTTAVRVLDTAPTVAAVLGLDVPSHMDGRPVLEAFDPVVASARATH
jgi:predicted AlkP superfamily pyrophosphatase or phosphodiesterase